ncbi:MAG: hypothetical protein H6548_05240 [Chitinophagales bacterium]|nr:hypothetical protein [Chitinophagales bacterium]HQU76865.1 hypothetical protein [Chitinophagales bacterium]
MDPEDLLSGNEHPAIPYHQEILVRDDFWQKQQEEWMAAGGFEQFLCLIKEAFLDGTLTEDHFRSLTGAMSDGWMIKWHAHRFSDDTLSRCADALRDVILPLGYTLYMSDLREFLRGDYVETIERHYLKPALVIKEGLADQLYGNILIEHRLIDRASYDLRMVVQYYHDQNFAYPQPFVKLLNTLCRSVM